MKTAMQELISQMHNLTWKLMDYEQKIEVFNIFLEKEKEQIMAAVHYGQNNSKESVYTEGKDYYNETYNQNK